MRTNSHHFTDFSFDEQVFGITLTRSQQIKNKTFETGQILSFFQAHKLNERKNGSCKKENK